MFDSTVYRTDFTFPSLNMLPSLGTSVHHIPVPATSPPGTQGVAERFMAALASVGVNVILTSQEGAGRPAI